MRVLDRESIIKNAFASSMDCGVKLGNDEECE